MGDERERLLKQLKDLKNQKNTNRIVQILSQHELMLSQMQSNIDRLTARKEAVKKRFEAELKRITEETDKEIAEISAQRQMLLEVVNEGKKMLGIDKKKKNKSVSKKERDR